MQFDDIALRGIKFRHASLPLRDDARSGILVPVNTSAGAFNALAYALNLARALHSSIHLFHVTDARDLPDSGNPLVIGRMLDRMETKASNCVVSLKEMIEESGVQVGRAESMVGNVERLVANKVEELMPEVLVLGQSSLPGPLIKSIVRQSGLPVIIVPDGAPAQLPESTMLSALGSPFSRSSMNIVNKLVLGTTTSVTAVSYRGNRKSKDACDLIGRYLPRGMRARIDEVQISDTRNTREVADFIRAHDFDLVCLARNQRPFWKRLFSTDTLYELAFRLEVSVMVL
jgi:hypothetical protein